VRADLTISIAAMPIVPYSSVADFAAHVDRYAAEAAQHGSELLLLPELACLGLLWGDPDVGNIKNAQIGEFYRRGLNKHLPAYRQALKDVAARSNLWLAGASFWHAEANGKGLNTGFMVAPDGGIAELDKIHPTRPEQVIGTVGGSSLRAFDVNGVKVGMLICYDSQFPELGRALFNQGVEVLLVPSLTSARGYWRVRYAAQARAQENQIYVCVSPLIGSLDIPIDHPSNCAGHAYIACPIDNKFGIENGLYASSEMNREFVLHATLDLELLRLSRAQGEIRNVKDRRTDIFAKLA
jgi:predicted amidohydrolase